MSTIVRGGQNLLHYFRMFDQVVKSLFMVVLGTVFLVGSYILYQRITLYNLKVYSWYLLARLYESIGAKNMVFSITNSFGRTQKYKVIEIVNNSEVIRLFHYVNEQTILAVYYGLKWGIIAAIITILTFALKGWQMAKKRTLKGQNLVKPFTLKKEIFFYNLKNFCFNPVKIAGISYPYNAEKTHTLITGASGTGKTVIISNSIAQVINKKGKAIIYDKMGVYVERFYDPKRDILLNPLDIRSANWNLLQECSKSSSLDTIAKAFIPNTKTSDPFWENAARIVFAESLNYLRKQGRLDNKSIQDIYFGADPTEFNIILKSSGILNKILSKDSERTTGSILAVMISYMRCLKYLNNTSSKQNFSIRDWILDDNKSGCLIISSRSDQHETLKPLISVFLELTINNLLSLKQNQSRIISLFLDELPTLHYLPSLQSGLSESRQFGGAFFLSLQLMAQLRSIYGRDLAESVSGLCRNRIVFSTPDEETANWCSGSLGKIETEETKESYSYGANQMRDGINLNKVQQIKPLVSPMEIMNQKNLSCYISFSGWPLTQNKIKPHDYPQIAERFLPRDEETIITETILKIGIDGQPRLRQEKRKEAVIKNDLFEEINEDEILESEEELIISEIELEPESRFFANEEDLKSKKDSDQKNQLSKNQSSEESKLLPNQIKNNTNNFF